MPQPGSREYSGPILRMLQIAPQPLPSGPLQRSDARASIKSLRTLQFAANGLIFKTSNQGDKAMAEEIPSDSRRRHDSGLMTFSTASAWFTTTFIELVAIGTVVSDHSGPRLNPGLSFQRRTPALRARGARRLRERFSPHRSGHGLGR